MNVFFTDRNPKIAVKHLNDQRLVNMVRETLQILSSAVNLHNGLPKILFEDPRFRKYFGPYRTTHKNHPVVKWASTNRANWDWLYNYFFAISDEYTSRYSKQHKSMTKLLDSNILELADNYLPQGEFTQPPNCAANDSFNLSFKHIDNVVTAYRVYLCARICLTDKNPRISKRDIDVNAYKSMFNVTDDDILSGIVQ